MQLKIYVQQLNLHQAQNKEYTKTEQELSKTLEDGNLVGAQRAGIMQEYTAAQGNTRQSFDLLIQKSKEYTQAIIDEKDISQGAQRCRSS